MIWSMICTQKLQPTPPASGVAISFNELETTFETCIDAPELSTTFRDFSAEVFLPSTDIEVAAEAEAEAEAERERPHKHKRSTIRDERVVGIIIIIITSN